ncbi:MAG: CDP-alcohol phosphatidyltransferase family protein [Bacilli bacterium]|nr:CDP-alcohol phosphatidyltransferase family protein [Bacilli bacterium]
MANILTIIRLIGTIPLVVIIGKNGLCLSSSLLFIFLGITDFLDGYIARKYNKCTNFGKVVDGIADKFLMLSVTIVLLAKNIIPYWTLLIFIRDISSCIFAILYIKKTGIIIKSNIFGNLKATLHILSIALTLLIGNWNLASAILLIIAILLFIPEIFSILKILRNKK